MATGPVADNTLQSPTTDPTNLATGQRSYSSHQAPVVDNQVIPAAATPWTGSTPADHSNGSREQQALAVWNSIPGDLESYILNLNGAQIQSESLGPGAAQPPRVNPTNVNSHPGRYRAADAYRAPARNPTAPETQLQRFPRSWPERQDKWLAPRPAAQGPPRDIGHARTCQNLGSSFDDAGRRTGITVILPNFDDKEICG